MAPKSVGMIYDAEGNRVEETDIATGAYTTYAYDFRQDLTSVTSYTSAGVVTQVVDYTYDAQGRQISESVAAGGTTTETKFVYDGEAIVATLDGTNALTNRYLDGPAVDQVFADEQFTPTSAGEMPTAAGTVIWPLVDNQGTDRDLVEYNAATGETTVVDHITYNSFGTVTSETNPAIDYLFGYTGFVQDLATGLDQSQSREYDPLDGLWTQQDPIGFGGGQANLSAYVGNGPTNGVDPSGNFTIVRTNDQRNQILAKATTELDAAVAAGTITNDEKELRLYIVTAVLSGKIGQQGSTPDKRDLTQWELRGEKDEETWEFSKSGTPTKAMLDAYQKTGDDQYCTMCRGAARLNNLKGQVDYAMKHGTAAQLNDYLQGKSLDDLFPDPNYDKGVTPGKFETVTYYEKGFDPSDLLPGDQVWVKNPAFDSIPKSVRDANTGDEGSNKIYVGAGLFSQPYGSDKAGVVLVTYPEFRESVSGYAGNPQESTLKINRVQRPQVPSF